jgi:bifunctional DNA-binding transcriptional regulator/antitoxin component of YhaV-PrlF toxin-antitoxin module
MTNVHVSPKFQIVIPKPERDYLKVKVGQTLTCIAKGGILYVVPVRPISELRGMLEWSEDALSDVREKKDREI